MNNPATPNHPILNPTDTHRMRLAAELIAVAEQADDNARRWANHRDDHGKPGSASRAFKSIATQLRWRAQMVLDGTHPTDTDQPGSVVA